MSKLVKESFKHLQPILTQVADRCINQIAATSPPAASDHIFEVEKAKKELIGLLVHIGSKPTEKMLLKQYIANLLPNHFLKIIHPFQLSMTANSIIDSLRQVSKGRWTEQTEREWRQLFDHLSEIVYEEFLQKNHADF